MTFDTNEQRVRPSDQAEEAREQADDFRTPYRAIRD